MSTLPHYISKFTARKTFVTSVAVGYRHVIAVERFRSAYAWGSNSFGELGVGDRVPYK